MFNLFAKKEMIITEVEGVKFVFDERTTRANKNKFSYLKECMSEVPQIVKDKLAERKLIVRFVNEEEILSVVDNKNVLGFYCDAGVEVIYIKSNQTYFQLKDTLFHEIGHFVDKFLGRINECDFISLSDISFQKIACKERFIYDFDYYRNNIKEYFAQSFSEFLLNSKKIGKAPHTKREMQWFIESLNC